MFNHQFVSIILSLSLESILFKLSLLAEPSMKYKLTQTSGFKPLDCVAAVLQQEALPCQEVQGVVMASARAESCLELSKLGWEGGVHMIFVFSFSNALNLKHSKAHKNEV